MKILEKRNQNKKPNPIFPDGIQKNGFFFYKNNPEKKHHVQVGREYHWWILYFLYNIIHDTFPPITFFLQSTPPKTGAYEIPEPQEVSMPYLGKESSQQPRKTIHISNQKKGGGGRLRLVNTPSKTHKQLKESPSPFQDIDRYKEYSKQIKIKNLINQDKTRQDARPDGIFNKKTSPKKT